MLKPNHHDTFGQHDQTIISPLSMKYKCSEQNKWADLSFSSIETIDKLKTNC